MRDPFSWSLPLVRVFGITIRVHFLFPAVAAAVILRVAFQKNPEGMAPPPPGLWVEACWLVALLFIAVLLHEFGHCAGARLVDGDAHEILIWPLGGLASIDVPHTPWANFIAAVAGPATNLLLCLASGSVLMACSFSCVELLYPWWNPYVVELRNWTDGVWYANQYAEFGEHHATQQLGIGMILLARFFWLNWILSLLNLVLVGYPMDMGRIFQCALWPRFGFRQATLAAVFAGFITSIIIGIYAVVRSDFLFLFLCLFIYMTCHKQWVILETGGEESLFGYDFSQGYTSLERDQPPRRRKPNFWQRWLQRRAARKLQQEMEQREFEERRMDELLEKVQRQGLQALTDEERRFLTRVSAKYRNRQ